MTTPLNNHVYTFRRVRNMLIFGQITRNFSQPLISQAEADLLDTRPELWTIFNTQRQILSAPEGLDDFWWSMYLNCFNEIPENIAHMSALHDIHNRAMHRALHPEEFSDELNVWDALDDNSKKGAPTDLTGPYYNFRRVRDMLIFGQRTRNFSQPLISQADADLLDSTPGRWEIFNKHRRILSWIPLPRYGDVWWTIYLNCFNQHFQNVANLRALHDIHNRAMHRALLHHSDSRLQSVSGRAAETWSTLPPSLTRDVTSFMQARRSRKRRVTSQKRRSRAHRRARK